MDKKLSESIVQTLDERNLNPRPRWHFLLKRSVFWSVAGISILLGGVAVAAIIFVFLDHDTGAAHYLNQDLAEDILLTIPYLWLITFALLIALTRMSIRYTKGGYRYGILQVAGIAFVASFILGIIMNKFDVGDKVDEYLNESIPYYDSLVYTSKDQWSQPEKGLLGGTVNSIVDQNNIVLNDSKHRQWKIDLSSTYDGDMPTIKQGDVVKIVGKDMGNNIFKAEEVFVWKNES